MRRGPALGIAVALVLLAAGLGAARNGAHAGTASCSTYTLDPPTLTTLPNGAVGHPYRATVTVSGNTPDPGTFYSWQHTGGDLPPGLNFHSEGTLHETLVIDGTPTTEGPDGYSSIFGVEANSCIDPSGTGRYTIKVGDAPKNTSPPSITAPNPPIVGSTAHCNDGVWTTPAAPTRENPTTFAWAWKREGDDTPIALDQDYLIQSADAGHSIVCEVTATNDFGTTEAVSAPFAIPEQADLSVDVVAISPAPAPVNQPVTITLTVANAGPNVARGASASLAPGPGLDAAGATTDRGTCIFVAQFVNCKLGDLGTDSSSRTAHIAVTVLPREAGTLDFTPRATSTTLDPISVNNQDKGSLIAFNPPSADLGVTLTGPYHAAAGSLVDITGSVKNNGNAVAQDVTATYSADGLVATALTFTQGDCKLSNGNLDCSLGDLMVNEVVTVKFKALVEPGSASTSGKLTATSLTTDPELDNNHAEWGLDVRPAAKIGSVVTPPDGSAKLTLTAGTPGKLDILATGPGGRRFDSSTAGRVTVAHVVKHVAKAGRVVVKIVPNARGRKYLKKHGTMKVLLRISFTPTGGSASTQKRSIVLHERRSH
jgi:hypothetical protein